MRTVWTVCLGVALAAGVLAQDFRVPVPSIEDDPRLPRVLLIGDSISIGYAVPVRRLLAGRANVHRIPANGGPTTNGTFLIDDWLGRGTWDVIHFNFGLHDLKRLDDGEPQVPLEAYRRYLKLIAARLKKTRARLIFATTTPVPEGKVSPPRLPADVALYNRAAVEVMHEAGIEVNDLYGRVLPRLKELQMPANVHFTNAGSEELARFVAGAISARLPETKP